MSEQKLKIYCDTNIYSRPFDKIISPRVYLETEACLEIVNLAKTDKIVLLSSDILCLEINRSELEKKLQIKPLLDFCHKNIQETEKTTALARRLETDLGLKPRDALHLASAILGRTDFFLTCDDEIIRKSALLSKRKLLPKIINPVDFLYHYYQQ